MLVLSRKPGEKIRISASLDELQKLIDTMKESGEESLELVEVVLVNSFDGRARLGFTAPRQFSIAREEVLKRASDDSQTEIETVK